MSENRDIKFIKPCRGQNEEHRLLTPEYAKAAIGKRRIVQINLDNCSIQRMEMLPTKPTLGDAEKVGLLPLVQMLQAAPIALSAIGINEMPDRYVAKAKSAYENFCAEFWPGHRDDIAATHRTYDETSTDQKVAFKELSDDARCTYGCAYVSLLQIQNLTGRYALEDPVKKFEIYLHSIVGMLDVVSAFELEIAKYAFWRLSEKEISTLPDGLKIRRRDIKENFTKHQPSLQKCKEFAFNGAMDIHWLSGANLSEDLGLTLKADSVELLVDNWVGTNDVKLYRISRDIHSVYRDGSRMKHLAVTREQLLDTSPYWTAVDDISKNVMIYRSQKGYRSLDNLLQRIDASVAHLEHELVHAFSKDG